MNLLAYKCAKVMKYVILDNEFIDLKAFDVRIDKLFIEIDVKTSLT